MAATDGKSKNCSIQKNECDRQNLTPKTKSTIHKTFTLHLDRNNKLQNPTGIFVDHMYGVDQYWEDHIYNQDILESRRNYNKPAEQLEDDYIIIDSHKSDTLRQALLELWTIHPQLPGTSPPPHFTPSVHPNKTRQQPFIDNEIALQLKSTPDASIKLLPLSTNFHLRKKKKRFYFPMGFGDSTTDGLIDTIAPQKVLKVGLPPNFYILVANGQLETPIAAIELQFKVGDITFLERFIVVANLANPLIGLLFLQRNDTVLQ